MSEVIPEPLRAYNLTVEGWHTYFVAANEDAAPVWVHNNCFGVPSTRGLVGTELEEHLIRHMPEGFSVGRVSSPVTGKIKEIDGGYVFNGKTIWYEAKSGNYWNNVYSSAIGREKFKRQIREAQAIAESRGFGYEVISNSPISTDAKRWLDKIGVPYREMLD